jgi:hypothetical protein
VEQPRTDGEFLDYMLGPKAMEEGPLAPPARLVLQVAVQSASRYNDGARLHAASRAIPRQQ